MNPRVKGRAYSRDDLVGSDEIMLDSRGDDMEPSDSRDDSSDDTAEVNTRKAEYADNKIDNEWLDDISLEDSRIRQGIVKW